MISTAMSVVQSDIPRPEGPANVAGIPGKGGERIGGGEEDRRAAQQPGEEEEERSSSSSSSCDLTHCLLFFSFSKSAGRTDDVSTKDFYFEIPGHFPCEKMTPVIVESLLSRQCNIPQATFVNKSE